MAQFYGDQHAHQIQMADQIQNFTVPDRDHLADGRRTLAAFLYPQARKSLGEALLDDPDNARTRFYLALALLDGKRPRRHRPEWINDIGAHLGHAAELPEAKVLSALVREDRALRQVVSDALPEWLADLVAQVPPALAEEIVTHFQAPENSVWCALRSRSES
jgi:hypothetical protein